MADFEDIPDLPISNAELALPLDVRSPGSGERPVTRAELGKRKLLAIAAGLAWLGVQLVTFGIRDDIRELRGAYLGALVFLPLFGGLASILLATRAGDIGLGTEPSLVRALALGLPAAYLLVAAFGPATSPTEREANWFRDMSCFDSVIVWTALPVLAGAVALRGTFAANARWRSALFGAGCGLTAGAVYALHCPYLSHWHTVASHGGAVLFACALCWACLPYVTRIS